MAQQGAMSFAYRAVNKGKYDSALAHLARAEKRTQPTPALQAEIAYLRGQCYEGLNRAPDAIGVYKYLAATFPDSQYAFQATERLRQLAQQ